MARRTRNRGFYVGVDGIEETIREIGLYQIKKKEAIKKVIQNTAKDVRRDAKKGAPKLTGKTKTSIKIKYFDFGLVAVVRPVLPDGWKAHFFEFGTIKMDERPFMKPAEDNNKQAYLCQIQSELMR